MHSRPLPGFDQTCVETKPGVNRAAPRGLDGEAGGNTGLNRENRENRVPAPIGTGEGDSSHVMPIIDGLGDAPVPLRSHGIDKELGSPGSPGSSQQTSGLERTGLENGPGSSRFSRAAGGLVARLCRWGAAIRSWAAESGDATEIEVPFDMLAGLAREIRARGWRIVPDGKRNPEAEHDSWLAGIPCRELER